jgi:hypothetical protein
MRNFLRRLRTFWRDEDGGWFLPLLLAIVFNVIAYLLTPKPKKTKPEAAKDLEDPTADAGRPIPVVFGTVTVKGLNILWFGDKRKLTREVNA